MTSEAINETSRQVGDVMSMFIALAAMIDWLPALAAILSIVWTAIRIFETRTVQALVRRIRERNAQG